MSRKIFIWLMIIGFCGALSVIVVERVKSAEIQPPFPSKTEKVYRCGDFWYIFKFAGQKILMYQKKHGTHGYFSLSTIFSNDMLPECHAIGIDPKQSQQLLHNYQTKPDFFPGVSGKYTCGNNWYAYTFADQVYLDFRNHRGTNAYAGTVHLGSTNNLYIGGYCKKFK